MTARDTAAERWRRELAEWAVPDEILASAPREPFVFVPAMFEAPPPDGRESPLATRRALEELPDGGTVLDVGCGGGAASFALAPPAGRLIGVDRQRDMLELFETTAAARGIAAETHLGAWPEIAAEVPIADVAVCHHVVYNAPDLPAFATAMSRHARQRVVIEMTHRHPQDVRRPLWRHFWGIERPDGPTSNVAAEALRESGFDVVVESGAGLVRPESDVAARFWCRMLCLPPEREPEVAEQLDGLSFPRERAVLWWDT